MKNFRSRLVTLAGIAFLATSPLIWMNVLGSSSGSTQPQGPGLGARPVHVALMLLFVAAAAAWGYSIVRWPRRGIGAWFDSVYAMLIVYSAATLTWNGSQAGIVSLAKNTIYFLISIGLYGVWRNLSYSSKTAIAKWGSLIGMMAFLAFAEITFTKLGRNFITEYAKAIATGNATALEFNFYPPLFNYKSSDVISNATDSYVSASLRNTLVGAFVVFFFLPFAYPTRSEGRSSKASVFFDIMVRYGIIGLSGLLVAVSVSRSNWLALAAGMMAVFVATVRKRKSRKEAMASGRQTVFFRVVVIFFALAMVSSALTTTIASGVSNIVTQRVSQASTDNRWDMYADALARIEQKPMGGYGLGSTVEAGASNKSVQVHNFLLATWFETGLFGAVLSAAAYCALFYAWCVGMSDKRFLSKSDGTRLAWICGLPALPLMRMLVSGGGDGLTLVEWATIAIFLAEWSAANEPIRETAPSPVASLEALPQGA